MSEPTGQQIVDAFFEALGMVQMHECQALLHVLHEIADREPAYRVWHTYLTGVLANELHHDWARGERIFLSLLDAELAPSMRGRVLIALGRTYDYQGRWDDAIDIYERCLTIFQEPDEAIDRAKIWKNMAITLQKGFAQGDLSEPALHRAITYCQSALAALHGTGSTETSEQWLEATTWNTLGVVHFSLGDWPQAIHCYEQRIELGRALSDTFGVAMARNNLGEVHHHQGPELWPQALHTYLEALAVYQQFGDTYEQVDALANLAALADDMGQLATARDYYMQATALIERLRAGISAETARANFFATTVDTYANAALLCAKIGDEATAFELVERARARAFLDTLAARSPDLPERVETATLSLAEVQAALPSDALLLEYFTTGLIEAHDRRAAGRPPQRHRFPPGRTLIFAITRKTIRIYDAGVSPNDLRPRQLDGVVEQHFLDPHIRRTLYDRLIGPAAPLLEGKAHLYLAPHGPLHYIPFQALVALDGETLLREGGPRIIYGPSATLLFRPGPSAHTQASLPSLAIGYDGAGENRLHFGEAEARGIARLSGGQVLTGPAPKKVVLYAEAAHYQLLHFSCHGRFDPNSPLDSALHLAPSENLTALDVLSHLRLRCDLVTLSACESGLSRVRRGDELIGLVRAFLFAGASALLCTLWRVDERSTRILMERFYHELLAGVDPAAALQRAQLALRTMTRAEARGALIHFLAEELLVRPPPDSTEGSPQITEEQSQEHAGVYLRGLTPQYADAHLLDPGTDNDLIFADPYYWAPFVLIGSGRAGHMKATDFSQSSDQ